MLYSMLSTYQFPISMLNRLNHRLPLVASLPFLEEYRRINAQLIFLLNLRNRTSYLLSLAATSSLLGI
ncbi:hypothetical protein DB41_AQ00040 [Neochlamydia sp. TUME1]|uniref:hypothetical protein n=1 Tax=Neochlamydia sp. TUME1 TaxID=1478174 RepID=UPI00057FED02|nr:hypothetical protein [Neochlamydia sp. TUME1]KIC71713.1 hypothetical protein DB41_AQ00040 [Neochlamydia sp. TUME1]